MEQFAGRDVALQILVTLLISRLANSSSDPNAYADALRQEALAAVNGSKITGVNVDEVRGAALKIVNETFQMLKPATTG